MAQPGGGARTTPRPPAAAHLDSFISICSRISCRSASVLLGKMLRSSSSCLLGRFLSFTASSSFLHFRGSVPESGEATGVSRLAPWPPTCRREEGRGLYGRAPCAGCPPGGALGRAGRRGPRRLPSLNPTRGPHTRTQATGRVVIPPGSPGAVLGDTCCPSVIRKSATSFQRSPRLAHDLVSLSTAPPPCHAAHGPHSSLPRPRGPPFRP